MTLKKFNAIKMAVAMILSAVVAQAVIINNLYLAIASVLIAIGLIITVKRRVKEVVADERDYEIAGQAARYSLTIFAIIGSIIVFVLIFLRHLNIMFEAIASVLSYAICSLLLLNSLIFGYLNRSFSFGRKIIYIILGAIITSIFVIAGLRLFSGEEGWICVDGQWVEHGHPSAPQPITGCDADK